MKNSKKWSIIALASVVLVSVAYFGSTGNISSLKSSVLTSPGFSTCEPVKLPFYPEYQKTLSELDVLIADIKTLKVNIKEAQSGIQTAESEIEARTKQNASYQTQIASLTKANRTLCSNPRQVLTCRQNRAQIAKFEVEIKNNNKKITEFKKTKAQLEKSLKEYEQQYTKLDASRLDKIVQIEAFEKQIEEVCKPPVVSGEVSYRAAKWSCYDNTQSKYEDVLGCTDSDIWRSFAEVSCANKCSSETGKCGVNQFSTGGECEITVPSVCGNGKVETGEQCDDGNKNEEDGCTNTCQIGPNICDITPDIPQCNTIKVISQDKDVEIDIQKPWKIQYSAPQEYDNSDIVINLVSLDGSQGMSFNSQFYKTTQVDKLRTVDMTVGGTTLQGKYRLKVCYFPKCNETYGESQGIITVLNTAYTPYVVLSTPWSSCQNNTQTRTVTCSKNVNGDVVDMSLCSNSGIYIPTSQRPCDTTTATQYFDTKIKSEGNNKFTISIKNISDRKLANISTISWGLDYTTSNCIRTINELFSLYSVQGKHFDPGESISYTCEDGAKSDTINIQSQGLDVVTGDAVKQFVEQKR